MKKKVLCIALALLMCMMVAVPAFADGEEETPPERAQITGSFGLEHVSGSTYQMWAVLSNPEEVSVYARLSLYDATYQYITSIYTIASNAFISLSKNINLSSGTYYIRLTFTADGPTHSFEKTYNL